MILDSLKSPIRGGRYFGTEARNWRPRNKRTVSHFTYRSRTGRCGIGSCSPGRTTPFVTIPMSNKLPLMRLCRDEEAFLRHWIYDEAHYLEGQGPAKKLQLQHRAIPGDLAILIAAWLPDTADQEAAGFAPPPPEPASWPWSEETFRARLAEARAVLARRSGEGFSGPESAQSSGTPTDRTSPGH
jgi:hypothetical protein